jgi:protein involved in polysaccharide export with SLBB domain
MAVVSVFFAVTNLVSAQSVIYGKPRPAASAQAPQGSLSTPVADDVEAGARAVVRVNPNTPITAGSEVSFSILEENEAPARVVIADTGDLELPGLPERVQVQGLTVNQAEAKVKSLIEGKYYKSGKATVRIGLNIVPSAGQKRSKVLVSGKVLRAGSVEFLSTSPKTLSEVLIEAGTSIYSDLKKVQVTRGNEKKEYNVKDIIDGGNTKNDFPLKDGDRINVPARGGFILTN